LRVVEKEEGRRHPVGRGPVPAVSTTAAVANNAAATQMVLLVAHPCDGGSSHHRALSTPFFEKNAADQELL
jgi:hypothetical protein